MIYEKIKALCKERGVAVTGLEKELGISRGSLCKIDKNKPSAEKIQKIADYFSVDVNWLNGSSEYRTQEDLFRHLDEQNNGLVSEVKKIQMFINLLKDMGYSVSVDGKDEDITSYILNKNNETYLIPVDDLDKLIDSTSKYIEFQLQSYKKER